METPDWAERVLAAAREQDASRPNKQRMSTHLHEAERSLVQEAARQRGMSLSAYMGRSVMAMVCYDLGLDWDTVMRNEGPIARGGQRAIYDKSPAAGQGFGNWRITDVR